MLKTALIVCSLLALVQCSRQADDFKSFFEKHEVVYPGVPVEIIPAAGKNRIGLLCLPSPDQSIVKYVVYWNNKGDSVVFENPSTKAGDTLTLVIPNLNEYVYSFELFTFDAKGNRSVPVNINAVRVFGVVYESRLLNRTVNQATPYVRNPDGSVQLNFNKADTINVYTNIRYTNNSDVIVDTVLRGDGLSITLPDYKLGTRAAYRTAYIPMRHSIDTFFAADYDSFPPVIVQLKLCDKSLFSEVHLPNDVQPYESGTGISKLWDGSTTPQEYPNIFHSDGNHLPHVMTFDMGRLYSSLGRIEETGRGSGHNPTRFEVWGIADITNAATTLRADDAGWKDEAIAKGWVLLGDFSRTDDGVNAQAFDLADDAPPVRYIRIRIITTKTGSTYSNMSELSFWNWE